MKNIFTMYCFFIGFNLLLAQTSEAAEKLLDEVSETIAAYENLSFDFSYVSRKQTRKDQTRN